MRLCARLRTHFLGVTGTGTRLPPKGPGQAPTATAVRRPNPVCPRRSSAAFFPCRPCAHAAVPTVHCVEARSNQRHPIGCAALAGARSSQSTLPCLIGDLSAGPRSHAPTLQPTGDAEGLGFHAPNKPMQTHYMPTHAHTAPLHGWEAARSSPCSCACFAAAYGVALVLQSSIVCMDARMYVCMYVCMDARMYVCMYVCMYACMYACMYVLYACMHVSM